MWKICLGYLIAATLFALDKAVTGNILSVIALIGVVVGVIGWVWSYFLPEDQPLGKPVRWNDDR